MTNYNKNIQSFPKSIFAGLFNFDQRSQFKAASGAAEAPKVKF
jgi:LemA protein